MSYDKAKEAVRENASIYLERITQPTNQEEMVYNLSKSMDHLIQAIESDLGEIKRRLAHVDRQP
jgi:monoamine oxidase